MTTDRKLDMFELLRAVDCRDSEWFSRQSADAQKAFAPMVATRWAATVNDGKESLYMLWLINERVNVHLFDLQKHPDLVYRLMASCGIGRALRHQWIAPHKRGGDGNKAFQFIADRYPLANHAELEIIMRLHSRESFAEFVGDCGITGAPAKEIMKAYDKFAQKSST